MFSTNAKIIETSYNDMILTDGSYSIHGIPIVECSNVGTNFKSYGPVNISETWVGGISSVDASSCVIINPSGGSNTQKCNQYSDLSFTITKLGTNYTISNDSVINGNTITICVKTDSNSNQFSEVTSEYKNKLSFGDGSGNKIPTGWKGLLYIIAGSLISLLLYVFFMFGPFMFWTKFAPNTVIMGDDDCNKGRTLLDRYFSHERDELPYNWRKYLICRPPKKEKPIVFS